MSYPGIRHGDSQWYVSIGSYFGWRFAPMRNNAPGILEFVIMELYPEGIKAVQAEELWNKLKKLEEI